MTPYDFIKPNKQGFDSDPLGYSALAWHKWGMGQTLEGYPFDLDKGPSNEDLKSPVLWLSHAHALSQAARVLLEGAPDLEQIPEIIRGVSHCQYHAIALMLVGYSLEVCLKTMIIIRKGPAAYQSDEKNHHHHNIEKLAEFIPDLTIKDKAILKGLTHFITWAGRYPDPGNGNMSRTNEIFTLSEEFKISAKDLFTLAAEIMAYVSQVVDEK